MKNKKTSVFQETYNKYLDQISRIELNQSFGEKLGINISNNTAQVPLFNELYEISAKEILNSSGKRPSFEICVVLCKYLLLCPAIGPTDNDWVTFKDFPDTGPLITYHINDVENPITKIFTGRLHELKEAGRLLGGVTPNIDLPYDVIMKFAPLPKVPVLLLFNDQDEEFPAKSSVLFEKRAEKYLDAECLAILGALFSNHLRQVIK